jgi:hypothetical protein
MSRPPMTTVSKPEFSIATFAFAFAMTVPPVMCPDHAQAAP